MPSLANFFFFSSRRRHTRCLSDWSSDVCSSDLGTFTTLSPLQPITATPYAVQSLNAASATTARSEERRVGKSVDLGGRRVIKKKKKTVQSMSQREAEI